MPPRPSSVQSDGSLHPAMSQSPMAQDRGMLQSKSKVFTEIREFAEASESERCLPLSPSFQGLCRETLRCPRMAPLSQPLHCHHANPQGDRCILGWAHISRTTQWAAMDSREDNMALKVCVHVDRHSWGLYEGEALFCLEIIFWCFKKNHCNGF